MGRIVLQGKSLRASTIIEVVVASVIFLLMFCLSLDMLTRLGSSHNSEELVEIAIDRDEYVREIKIGEYGYGNYLKSFDWGEITVKIQPYGDFPAVQDMEFIGMMKNGKKIFEYRFLIKK